MTRDRPCWSPALRLAEVFGAILDADHGGLFRISPDRDGWSSKQLYLPDTAVLITRFLMPDGVGEVQDFMPLRVAARRRTATAEPRGTRTLCDRASRSSS